MPLLSVITTTYNRAHLIEEVVKSVLAQSFTDFEYIIVDDGSTDSTKSVIDKYLADPRIKYYKIENSERGFARNFGIRNSIGSFVTFVDSDDWLHPNHLKSAKEKLDEQPQLKVFYLNYEVFTLEGKLLSIGKLPKNNTILTICNKNLLGPAGCFVERNIMLDNLFDEDRNFNIAEDLYVWVKLFSKNKPSFFDEITVKYIIHGSNTMQTLDYDRVIYCRNRLIELLKKEPAFMLNYSKGLHLIYRSQTSLACDTLNSHGKAIKPFFLNIGIALKHPQEIVQKRFWANFKNSFLNLFVRKK